MGASGFPSPQTIRVPCLSNPHSPQFCRFSGVGSSGHNEAQKSDKIFSTFIKDFSLICPNYF
jgi:hypothetical protein